MKTKALLWITHLKHTHRYAGVTLVELMVTLSVLALLVSLAAPSLGSFVASRSVSAASSALASDYRLARSEAVQRSSPVSICQSSNGASCVTTTVGWQSGWIVFADSNGNGLVESATDPVLRVQSSLSGISSMANSTPTSTRIVATFRANGIGVGINDSLVVTPSLSGSQTRLLCISNQGRVAIRSAGVSSC